MLLCSTIADNAQALREGFGYVLFDGDMKHNLEETKRVGFDGAEFFVTDPFGFDFDGMYSYADSLGLKVKTFGTILLACKYGVSLVNEDAEKAAYASKLLTQTVKQAAAHSAYVAVGGFRGKMLSRSKADYFELLSKALKPILKICEDNGTHIALEAITKGITDWGHAAADICEFIDYVGSPALKVHYDTIHGFNEEKNQAEALLALGDRLGHVHLTDSNRIYPGQAEIDFVPIMAALKKLNYSGEASFEYSPVPDPFTAASLGLAHIRKCMGE